ncbi:MAG: response regulator transcription factor [Dongiaceae bacterium]
MRLLLVEDNDRLAGLVAQGLAAAGFTVDTLASLDEAMSALMTTRFDIIVLDLGLPDGDGMEVLRALRGRGDQTPILILTARDGLSDRVLGLNAGADDYLLKPFEMDELVARLKALLRRPGGALGVVLEIGNLRFDTVRRSVELDAQPLVLSRRELMLLESLLRSAGRVVAKNVLEEGMYGFGEQVTSNSLEVLVSRLRKKLLSAGARIGIHTVRGVGYMVSDEPAP